VARANLDRPNGKRHAGWLHELKVHDKLKALEMLGKHLGLFKDAADGATDWQELAARLASARTECVDPLEGRGSMGPWERGRERCRQPAC
jgi:hypothetical protein